MPGGKNNINGTDGNTFSSENQPKNRRKSTKFLTELLKKELLSKDEIIVEGVDVETGNKVKVKITNPNKETVVKALLKKAAKGDVIAIKEIFDRIEGKVTQPLDIDGIPDAGIVPTINVYNTGPAPANSEGEVTP